MTIRVAAVEPGPEPRPRAAAGRDAGGERARGSLRRRVGRDTACSAGEPEAGFAARGPCVFELPEATLVLPPGWKASVDEAGTIDARVLRGGAEEQPVNGEVVPRPRRAAGDDGRAACRLRRDGRRPDPLRALAEHHRAPRLLDGALRRRRRAGHAGGAHPGAPRLDARRRRRDRRRGAPRRRPLDPQRPLPGRHPPPRHHADLARLRSAASCSASPRAAPTTPTSAAPPRAACRRSR